MLKTPTQKNQNNPRPTDYSFITDCLFGSAKALMLITIGLHRSFLLGLKFNKIPWTKILIGNTLVSVAIVCELDLFFLEKIGLENPYQLLLGNNLTLHYLMRNFLIFFGSFLTWLIVDAAKFEIKKNSVHRALRASGLDSKDFAKPTLKYERKIDQDLSTLSIRKGAFSLKDFQNAKDKIESILGIQIDHFNDKIEDKTLEIHFSKTPLSKNIHMSEIPATKTTSEIYLGRSRSTWVKLNFKKTPHILIGGQTNGGKSNLLRGIILSLYENNPLSELLLVDLKEGLEFHVFRNLNRVQFHSSTLALKGTFEKLCHEMEKRLRTLKSKECTNIDEYNRLKGVKKLGRKFIVIDEATELFYTGKHMLHEDSKKLLIHCQRLTALGRAAGFHIIIATQKPDRDAVPMNIKANLGGRISLPMSDNASSQVILDSNRARLLPPVAGRAIWKEGLKQTEFQVPNFNLECVKERIQKISEKEKNTHQEKQSTPTQQEKTSEKNSNSTQEKKFIE